MAHKRQLRGLPRLQKNSCFCFFFWSPVLLATALYILGDKEQSSSKCSDPLLASSEQLDNGLLLQKHPKVFTTHAQQQQLQTDDLYLTSTFQILIIHILQEPGCVDIFNVLIVRDAF